MKIIILGTGTSVGIPMIGCSCAVCRSDDPRDKRLRTAAYLETPDLRLCIDTGPDFRQQMLQNGITRLDAVLFTHSHQDHIAGLDDTRPFSIFQQRSLDLYADALTQDALRRSFFYAFDPQFKYPGGPDLSLHSIEHGKAFRIGTTDIIPITITHGNLPILGFRIGDFTYITDASHISPESQAQIKGSKVLILNALRLQPHWSHFSLSQALEMIDCLQPERAYLTHFSHQIGKHAEVETQLPTHIRLAYDGLEIVV